jgi:hypothetical protein
METVLRRLNNMAKHYLLGYGYKYNRCISNGLFNLLSEKGGEIKVVCNVVEGYQNEVISQIRRHVDDVSYVYTEEQTGDNQYTIEGDDVNYWNTFEEALLYKVDPEGELESLDTSPFTVTLSRKANDTVKGSDTCRTLYSCKSMQEVIGNLWHHPYIHNLAGFTEQQVLALHELSRRIITLKEIK